MSDGVVAEENAAPTGALTRAAVEEGWPDAIDLGEMVEEEEDEEDASPGDIEEDPDDLPASDLAALRVAVQEAAEEE